MKLKRLSFMRVENRFGPDDALPQLADMLRYDVAFQSSVSPEYIVFPTFGTKDGNLGGRITTDRWHSFGVHLRFLETAPIDLLSRAARAKPDVWITYRHGRDANGAFNYSKLVPFTLADYLAAKTTDDVDVMPPAVVSTKGKEFRPLS